MIRNEAWFPLRIWCADKCKLESAFYKKYATLALIINLKTLYLKHPYVVIRVNVFVQRSLLLIKGVEEKRRKKKIFEVKNFYFSYCKKRVYFRWDFCHLSYGYYLGNSLLYFCFHFDQKRKKASITFEVNLSLSLFIFIFLIHLMKFLKGVFFYFMFIFWVLRGWSNTLGHVNFVSWVCLRKKFDKIWFWCYL